MSKSRPRRHRADPPADVCEYCDQPFATTDRLALHKGLEHGQALTGTEHEAFVAARADEEDALRTFRLKALGVLIIVYFEFLMLYAIFA